MKKILITLSPIALALFLSACGGGSDNKTAFEVQDLSVVTCDNTNPVFTSLNSGDVIEKKESNTQVQIVHNSNGSKKVCVISGSAHILR